MVGDNRSIDKVERPQHVQVDLQVCEALPCAPVLDLLGTFLFQVLQCAVKLARKLARWRQADALEV